MTQRLYRIEKPTHGLALTISRADHLRLNPVGPASSDGALENRINVTIGGCATMSTGMPAYNYFVSVKWLYDLEWGIRTPLPRDLIYE